MGKLIKTKDTQKHPAGTILQGLKVENGWKIYFEDYPEEYVIYPEDYPVMELEEWRMEQIRKILD